MKVRTLSLAALLLAAGVLLGAASRRAAGPVRIPDGYRAIAIPKSAKALRGYRPGQKAAVYAVVDSLFLKDYPGAKVRGGRILLAGRAVVVDVRRPTKTLRTGTLRLACSMAEVQYVVLALRRGLRLKIAVRGRKK